MDKQAYGQYILRLMDEEEDYADQEIDEALLYGYFQMYMPSGKGVEATFEPFADGHAYLQRIMSIYNMLDPADFTGEAVPGYFHSRAKDAAPAQLQQYGQQLINGIKQLLAEYADEAESVEQLAYLNSINEVVVLSAGELNSVRKRYDSAIYEAVFEVVSEHKNYGEPIEILNEAYFSIACDYWISYYLQWHRYKLNGDPFAPYFELYRLGYAAIFADNKLYIGS